MCDCINEVANKVAEHLKTNKVEIDGKPTMDAALMLDTMLMSTSTKVNYVQKTKTRSGEKLTKKSVSITHRFCPFCGEDKQKQAA